MTSLKFSDLQLDSSLQSAIDQLGYQECTPIQTVTMPHILAGQDVSGLAQTGTGKTAAFLVPLMERILRGRPNATPGSENVKPFTDWKSQNFVLILVPTRELAEQVYENVVKLSQVSGLRGIAVYGGTSYDKQKEAFRQGIEFVVATPGRLIDLYKEHVIDLKQVRAIVFDEADRMFDMGFKDDMKYILQRVPRERQFLVFSATLNFDVLNTAYQFGAEPIEINISKDQAKAENVKDEILHVGQDEKPRYLLSILKKHEPKQVIVFSNFKMSVERIANFLSSNGQPAMAISSLLSQAQRNRVLEQFKSENEKNILVATDVAARGLDIKGVDMVVNFELPNDAESYVHRIGRTGRAGSEGTAISLVSDRDVEALGRIEDYLKHKISIGWMEDTDLLTEFKPFPEEQRSRPRPFRNEERGGDQGRDRKRGPRPHSRDRNDRNDRGERRPRPERSEMRGERPENRSEGRPDRNARPGKGAPGGRPHQRRPEGSKPQGPHKQHPQKQAHQGNGKHHSHRKPGGPRPQVAKGAAPASVTQKVAGFFKKLFGNSAQPKKNS